MNSANDDPYLWLEEIQGETALEWVKERNRRTSDRYERTELFQDIYESSLAILNSEEKLVYPSMLGDYAYNFWRDAFHERGLLRRCLLENFLRGEPDWEMVLDLDALAAEEGENWVYKGHQALPPDYDRTLLWLSRGGSDAVVAREFDLVNLRFVEDGFQVPEAKSDLSWKDRDTLYIGTDFGPGSMTVSGYPRVLKVWKRGLPLSQAEPLFEVAHDDLAAGVWVVRRVDEEYDFVVRAIDFWNDEKFLVENGRLQRLALPSDAPVQAVFKGQIFVLLRSDWEKAEGTFGKGSLLSLDLRALADGGDPPAVLVFDPSGGGTVEGVDAVRDHIIVTVTENVRTHLRRYRWTGESWDWESIPLGEGGSTSLAATSRRREAFFLTHENYLTPTSLYFRSEEGELRHIKSLPVRFLSDNLVAEQHWAVSRDGTRIPYDVIRPREIPAEGAPTLLYGYGGFEVSLLPSYLSLAGPAWLARGGVYVSANIRGGGEFGPAWHQAALRENRHKAYEDFEAVAEDLIRRGITTSAKLGVHGRSNGGLLTGNMLVRRPELFAAVLIGVPLLDMFRYNKLLAGASWVAEYGDPDKPEDWAFLKDYSPYHNIDPAAKYPVPLIFTSTKDDRVHPGHARKMAAKLESYGFEVIYYENLEGGHAGASNNPQTAFFTALNYAYLWDRLDGQPETCGDAAGVKDQDTKSEATR